MKKPAFMLGLVFGLLPPAWACEETPAPSAVERSGVAEVGFAVAKVALAPDGSAMALAGRGGEAAVVRLADATMHKGKTAISNPVSLVYAPDGSEIWVIARGGRVQRLNPANAAAIEGQGWETQAAGLRISSPALGRFVLDDGRARVEVPGRIVALSDGRLDAGGAVLIAARPDRVAAFRPGALAVPAQLDSAPVGAMAQACAGACLITAQAPRSGEAYLWNLKPFDGAPRRLGGNPFLDGDALASDCSGTQALLLAQGKLRRASLPPGSAPEGTARALDVARAKLTADGRHALVMHPNEGWEVYAADTLKLVRPPASLASPRTSAVISPDGAHAVYPAQSGGAHLVATPYREVRRFREPLERLSPTFSSTGTLVAVATKGGFRLLRSADGKELGVLAGSDIFFAPGDRHVVTLGERVLVHRLSRP